MESDKELLLKEIHEDDSSCINNLFSKFTKSPEYISLFQAYVMFVGFTIGCAMLILPYSVHQLGPVIWIMALVLLMSVSAFCTFILNTCCTKFMESREGPLEAKGTLYVIMARDVVGLSFSKALFSTIQFSYFVLPICYLLLAATTISTMVHIDHWSIGDRIRLWTAIIFFISLPLMYRGSYKDLLHESIFAVITVTISFIILMVICIFLTYENKYIKTKFFHQSKTSAQNIFIALGTIFYTTVGPPLIVCNVSEFAFERHKLHYPISASFITVLLTYGLCGLVPYVIFGSFIQPTYTNTIAVFINGNKLLQVLLTIAQLSLVAHMIAATVLVINPLFTNAEKYFQVNSFGWKRVILRSSILLVVIGICEAFPNFEPLISLVGGIPFVLITIIFPMIIYGHLYKLKAASKIIVFVFCFCAIIFMIGNFVFNMKVTVNLLTKI